MNYYSYRLDHDYGLAPNPFGGYCTLVVCKPDIRKSSKLSIGDWIFGTGSKAIEKNTGIECQKSLIYAMKVGEMIGMNDYWNDPRFNYKKPIVGGSRVTMFGDNFYHIDETSGEWIQENSAHSLEGKPNLDHMAADLKGKNALISNEFFYFGDKAPFIPEEHSNIIHSTQGMKCPEGEEGSAFVNWLYSNFNTGINGYPCDWRQMKKNGQLNLF